MECSTFNMKMLTEDMLQSSLQQMFKMASHSTDTSPEISFIHQSPRQLSAVYAIPDCTQTLLQFFQSLFILVFIVQPYDDYETVCFGHMLEACALCVLLKTCFYCNLDFM